MRTIIVAVFACLLTATASAQVVLTGRLTGPRVPEAKEQVPYSAIYCFASLPGSDSESLSFRTWETEPPGWFKLAGGAGRYTVAFTNPASLMRPVIMTNLFARDGETVSLAPTPRADYAMFYELGYDTKPATTYYQTFTAKGTGVTQVAFRLAHDGVDGPGPGKQNLLVSVHRKGDGHARQPDTWQQVGPMAKVLDVDSGGPKNYIWSAGYASGEVPLKPGELYAVRIRAEKDGGTFQAFWRDLGEKAALQPECFRAGKEGEGFTNKQLWMNIGTDGDGLLIPYPKRIHKQFGELTKFGKRWSQTYTAQGKGLASVVLYAAVSGAQPELRRQRVKVTVREGGPGGAAVGAPKIAVGNGNWTGDASWGVFGCAFAPGEVALTPGKTYAIDFESIEGYDTIHGYINIKGVVSNDKPGFNPYRKQPGDECATGKAYFNGTDEVDYDLDMQVIEYEHAPAGDWARATAGDNLVRNGDMETDAAKESDVVIASWNVFAAEEFCAEHERPLRQPEGRNRFARLTGPHDNKRIDGGFMQCVENLDPRETYLLSLLVRCNWPLDDEHQCSIGYDPTGQTKDMNAATIVWTKLPRVHGEWLPHESEPIRPKKNAVSIWLRGRTTRNHDKNAPFRVDFDDVSFKRVRTDAP